MPNIYFINAEGAGFADNINVPEGTTLNQLFASKVGEGKDPKDYKIRLTRDSVRYSEVAANDALQEGDRVSITPAKIKGN